MAEPDSVIQAEVGGVNRKIHDCKSRAGRGLKSPIGETYHYSNNNAHII